MINILNIFKKTRKAEQEIKNKILENITIFVFYEKKEYAEYFSAIINNIQGLKIFYYNNIEMMIKDIEQKKPKFIITVLFNMKGIGNVDSAKEIIIKIKKICDATIIGLDGIYDPEKYLMADFDYFLPLNTNSSKIYTLLYKIITNQKIPEDEKSLIFEKEEFYDYVAKGNLFEKRVSKTADTNKELKFLLPRLKGKILDAGCGNGRLSIPIAKLGYEIIGIDISDELIKQANKNKGEKKYPIFIKGNLLQMPFNNGEFNTVIMMWHVICDLRKYQLELLREISRVTAKEGTLIFDIPDSSKHIKINESGVYEFKIDAFNKYVGLVPDLKEILVFLKATGFTKIIYNRVNWGSPKFVITAKKESLF